MAVEFRALGFSLSLMRFLTLELCKKHVNVEHNEDDSYIEGAAAAAELAVENYLQCPLEEYCDASGALPNDIMHGILLFFGSLYATREAFTSFDSKAQQSILALLNPRIKYGYSSR